HRPLPHLLLFFFSSRRRHTRFSRDWSSDVCSSDLKRPTQYREIELSPNVDLDEFVAGTPYVVETVLIPESGTGLVEITSSSLDRSEERRVGKEWSSAWAAALS